MNPPVPPSHRLPRHPSSPRRGFGQTESRPWCLLGLPLLAWTLATTPLVAGEVEIFVGETQKAVAKGELDGVSVDGEGTIELARRVTPLATLEEPFVFSAAGLAEGWAVGTGNSGKVLQVAADGGVETLAILGDLGVFALARDGDHLLAATAPGGKIYRLDPRTGDGEEYFDPEATYVWAMARDTEGRLLVATGAPGRLLRVSERGGELRSEVLYTSRDGHVRALHLLPDGGILLGTAGQGLIVHLDGKGEATTVHDAVHPEVLGFAAGDDDRVYAAVLASEASLVDLSGQTSGSTGGGEEATVTVVEGKQPTVGSRGSGFGEARSLVLALDGEALTGHGGVEEVARFADVTLHSLLWHDGILWLGTGQEGGLYRLTEDGPVAEREVEERQLAAMAAGDDGAVVVTANGSAVYRLESRVVAEGTYSSPTLDAEQVARFGTFRWQGEHPRGSELELAFRSGLSDSPDATWSDWQKVPCGRGTSCATPVGRRYEVPLADLPTGRFVQWRATLRGGDGGGPRIERTELSYRQLNRRPEIEGLEVMDPGAILVPSSFNPQNQTFEPWSPNKDGIFTSLEAALDEDDGRLKTLWKKGYQTLRWEASDPNDDTLHYRLEVRPEDGWSSGDDGGWLEMVDEHDEDYYSFDATVLPDGVYRFRLTASDRRPQGGEAEVLRDDHTSPPVILDHRPPELGDVRRQGQGLRVEVRDALLPLRDAVFSIDAGSWHPAKVVDGLLDGRRETLEIAVPTDARVVLLRLTDAAFNVVTYEVSSPTE